MIKATVHFDGQCVPNPGHGAGAFILRIGEQEPVKQRLDFGDDCTNNVAEYRAAIEGMKAAADAGVTHLRVYGDSEIVIRGISSMKHNPKGKPHLEKLKLIAIAIAQRFENVTFQWIPREQNSECDELALGDSPRRDYLPPSTPSQRSYLRSLGYLQDAAAKPLESLNISEASQAISRLKKQTQFAGGSR